MLDWQDVARRRARAWLGGTLIYRDQIDSTNALAAALIPREATPGAVIVADFQYAGRGRLGRRWLAAPGSALTCTVVLGPFAPAWGAPMAAGLAIVDALAEHQVQATLKWPNDVLIAGSKCAGILIETRRVEHEYWLLAGIGINVGTVDPDLVSATFLNAHAPVPVRREDLLVSLLAHLERWCRRAGEDGAAVREAWRALLVTLGRNVTVRTPTEAIDGIAQDVAPDGALLLRLADGSIHMVHAGDVTLAAEVSPRT